MPPDLRTRTHRSGYILKLADFGISKHLASGSISGRPRSSSAAAPPATHTFDIGTDPYQSPELCGVQYFSLSTCGPRGGAISCHGAGDGEGAGQRQRARQLSGRPTCGYDPFAADLWALACVTYEVCTATRACAYAPDAAFSSSLSCLRRVTLPRLPAPPLFRAEWQHRLSTAHNADTTVVVAAGDSCHPHDDCDGLGVELCGALRREVNAAIEGWGRMRPEERPAVAQLLRSASWCELQSMSVRASRRVGERASPFH